MIGIVIAFTGIILSTLLKDPYLDGIASLLIGILLTSVAVLLVRESRSLLMGESADQDEIEKIIAIAKKHKLVVCRFTSVHFFRT